MALQGTLMESLLTWVNSLKVDHPIEHLSQLQDLNIIIKIVNKLNGSADQHPQILLKPLEDRLAFLQKHCRCGSKVENLVQWERMVHGENSDLELCKILVLLFYVSNMKCKNAQEWESFDHKTQTNLASILRFVLDNEENLFLDDKLIRFLQRKDPIITTSESGSSSDETVSPNVPVHFLELHRVASSSSMRSIPLDSPSSPMSEVLHMPQFQIQRLQKQLIEGRDLRDELELELSETRKRLAEKDAQIFLMQQKIERLRVLNEMQADQQEQQLEELREKNESLMIRLRDALKQCRYIKTDRKQLERRNNQLLDENGDLSYKVRDLSKRLAQLQDALNETTEEHEQSLTGWQQQQSQLQNELNAAITEKELQEEHNQILQGKISTLEDQLKRMMESDQSQKGENMGDVLRLDSLQQEVTLLNTKSLELQAQITELEERLTCQITTLKLEISKLKSSLAQKDEAISSLQHEMEEGKRGTEQLRNTLQIQEESARKNIEQLSHQVDHLSTSLTISEGKSVELVEKLNAAAQQMTSLEQERNQIAVERDSTFKAYNDYKSDKEEQLRTLSQTCQSLQNDHQQSLSAAEELKKEKAELVLKVQELDATILDLVAKCQHLDSEKDAQSKSLSAALESLKTQLAEQGVQLRIYKQKALKVKEKLLSIKSKVEYADRQLRELNKFQVATDVLKSRESLFPWLVTRSRADVSTDSLEMSDEDETPMNSTRKKGRTHREPSTTANTNSPESLGSNRLPKKVESLESLYFTPIPTTRAQSKLDSSIGSIADLSLDSSKKTRSARRRTTQVINITKTKPSILSTTITDYDLKTGDPSETLRRATLLSSQPTTLASTRIEQGGRIATRQHIKRETRESPTTAQTPRRLYRQTREEPKAEGGVSEDEARNALKGAGARETGSFVHK